MFSKSIITVLLSIGLALGFSGTATAAPGAVWDRVAQCESGGKWGTNTGNGYSGGLQFHPQTWRAHGGSGNPANASREQQIAVAERVLASQGWGAWPVCSRKAGARGVKAEVGKTNLRAPTSSRTSGVYTVKGGDTLGAVATRYGTTARKIKAKNPGVTSEHRIYVGQQLRL